MLLSVVLAGVLGVVVALAMAVGVVVGAGVVVASSTVENGSSLKDSQNQLLLWKCLWRQETIIMYC